MEVKSNNACIHKRLDLTSEHCWPDCLDIQYSWPVALGTAYVRSPRRRISRWSDKDCRLARMSSGHHCLIRDLGLIKGGKGLRHHEVAPRCLLMVQPNAGGHLLVIARRTIVRQSLQHFQGLQIEFLITTLRLSGLFP